MRKRQVPYMPEPSPLTSIEVIGGIRFTHRELGVIACLLNGRAAKTIASFLSIAPKTVEAHVRNIMLKLACNSREGIVNFVEKSPELSLVKTLYLDLLALATFEKWLRLLSSLVARKKVTCFVAQHGQKSPKQLIEHLKSAGIDVCLGREKASVSSLGKSIESYNATCVIYCLSEQNLSRLQANDTPESKNLSKFIQKTNPRPIVFFLPNRFAADIPKEICDVGYLQLETGKSYFSLFLEILKKIVPDMNIDELALDFKRQCDSIYSGNAVTSEKEASGRGESNQASCSKRFLVSNKRWLYVFFIMSTIFLGFLFLRNDHGNVRSDHIIPAANTTLKRPSLMTKIGERFKGGEDIQTVVLVGIGGAGKTTLARQYLYSQKSPVIWEINAETKTSIETSFKNLAHALVKTQEQRNELDFIQRQTPDEQAKAFLLFVKKHLKEKSNWFLVYDNVASFSDISTHFPHDPEMWGTGKVLITTRNINMKDVCHIKPENIITIGELGNDESLTLLCEILYNNPPSSLTGPQREEACNFLQNIPPFPLDVSVAAYYIKNHQITYEQYLDRTKCFSENFEEVQKTLLKEGSDYTKTRYGILTSSFNALMDISLDFKDLLFFISLLDSQNIPKSLLESYKDPVTIDQFLHHLRAFSLIIGENEQGNGKLSFHRSIHTLSFFYLLNLLRDEEKREITNKILTFLTGTNENVSGAFLVYQNESGEIIARLSEFMPHVKALIEHIRKIGIRDERLLALGQIAGIFLNNEGYIEGEDILRMTLSLAKEMGATRQEIRCISHFLAHSCLVHPLGLEKLVSLIREGYTPSIYQKLWLETKSAAQNNLKENLKKTDQDYEKFLRMRDEEIVEDLKPRICNAGGLFCPDENRLKAQVYMLRGIFLLSTNPYEAEKAFRKRHELHRKSYGEISTNRNYADDWLWIGRSLLKQGKTEGGLDCLKKSKVILEKLYKNGENLILNYVDSSFKGVSSGSEEAIKKITEDKPNCWWSPVFPPRCSTLECLTSHNTDVS